MKKCCVGVVSGHIAPNHLLAILKRSRKAINRSTNVAMQVLYIQWNAILLFLLPLDFIPRAQIVATTNHHKASQPGKVAGR